MRMISRYKQSLDFVLLFSVISSAALLLTLIDVDGKVGVLVKILTSLLFWGGLVAEQVFFWKAAKQRKAIESEVSGRKYRGLPGIFSFFRTKLGIASDVTFIISLVIFIVLAIGNWGENVAQYILLFLIVLSFRLHCITNGQNYRYKLYLRKRRAQS